MTQDHGYGLASMVKYMADIGTPKIIGNIYKDMRDYWLWNNGKYSIEAVLDAMGSGSRDNLNWWSDYFISLLQGSIYPEMATMSRFYFDEKAIMGTLGNSSYLDSVGSSVKTQDLSAKPFLIDISGGNPLESTNAATFSALQIMKLPDGNYLSTAMNAGIMVFKAPKAGPYEYLAGYHDQPVVTVGNLQDGMKLLVLLLNNRHVAPYSDKTDFEFEGHLGNTHFTASDGIASFEGWLYGAKNLWRGPGSSHLNAVYPADGETVTFDVIINLNPCDPLKTYDVEIEVFGQSKTAQMGCGSPLQIWNSAEVTRYGDRQVSAYVTVDNTIYQMAINEPWF